MIRRPPRSTLSSSSAASDVYKRQGLTCDDTACPRVSAPRIVYDLNMASVYPKKINGKTYYYLREMARVEGKPKMVSERYLGSAADIEAAIDGAQAGMVPARTRHLRFGDVAAVWSLLSDLDVIAVIDEVVGSRRGGAGASVGTYLALAALGRLVEPGSKRRFAKWWAGTAADRFTRISATVLDHRKFWEAMP